MTSKLLEIRDEGTLIPVLAIQLTPANTMEMVYLKDAGYPLTKDFAVLVVRMRDGKASVDPYGWECGGRTMSRAHQHIRDWFDELQPGGVICVETLLGERDQPKEPCIWKG